MAKHFFILPRSFDPLEFLDSRLALHADDARWLVSTIVRKTANRDTDPWGCARLHSDVLRRNMDKDCIVRIVSALEDGGAIETAPYCAGVKAKGYRLGKRYLGDRHIRVPAIDPRLIERIERERQRQQQDEIRSRWKPIHYVLDQEQRLVTITAEADAILDQLPAQTLLCQDVLVGHILRGEYPFSVSSTGRVFNSITGLKRELRSALLIDGCPVGSVDIRNAQPALLALLITQQVPSNGPKSPETYKHERVLSACPGSPSLLLPAPLLLPPCVASLALRSDVADFCRLACSGLLYELLMALSGLDRQSVKLALLRDVLAKRGRYPSTVENAFRQTFPSVHATIRLLNRSDHGELIRLLQRLESWLVIEQVSPRLVEKVHIVTLHDAIYARQQDLPAVEAAFEGVFDDLGVRMSLKCESHG